MEFVGTCVVCGLQKPDTPLDDTPPLDPPLELPAVQAPTMGIWSTGDIALTEKQMTGSEAFVSGPWRYEKIEGPGHWMQLEAPDAVNELLLDFLPA